MNNNHNVTISAADASNVDCSCGLKNATALAIANHLKGVLAEKNSTPTNTDNPQDVSPDFIRHIEIATGKRHIVVNKQDYYISEEEVNALREKVGRDDTK